MEKPYPDLLLHACCAPCSTTACERLSSQFALHLFYYNPNIHPLEEYLKRGEEIQRLSRLVGVPVVQANYNPDIFFEAVKGLESCKEGGHRCSVCFRLRLMATALKAKELEIPFFATTLTVSPHKNAECINRIGAEVALEVGSVTYLPTNFKKQEGYKRSLELSRQYGLYRQNYCGCLFSNWTLNKTD